MYHNYCCFTFLSEIKRFKMLGLYLNTIIIKFCSMLSILYELPLQKELPHFMTKMCLDIKVKTQ